MEKKDVPDRWSRIRKQLIVNRFGDKTMIRQCAWCKGMMGEVAPVADKRITHGICKKCEIAMKKDSAKVQKG